MNAKKGRKYSCKTLLNLEWDGGAQQYRTVTYHGPTAVLRLSHYAQRWCSYLLLCARHSTHVHPLYRLYRGGPWTYRVTYISWPQTKTCPGSRYFLAHGWVGVLTCKGVRQNSASPKRISLVSNSGAKCESSTWDHSTQYWFATS